MKFNKSKLRITRTNPWALLFSSMGSGLQGWSTPRIIHPRRLLLFTKEDAARISRYHLDPAQPKPKAHQKFAFSYRMVVGVPRCRWRSHCCKGNSALNTLQSKKLEEMSASVEILQGVDHAK